MGFAEMAVFSIGPESNLSNGLRGLRSNYAHAFSTCCEANVNQAEPDADMSVCVESRMAGGRSADATSAAARRSTFDDAAVF